MQNFEQLLGMGAPLTSAFRSPTPSILAKRQIRQGPQNLSRLMPQEPQMQMPGGGLGSLQDIAKMLMQHSYQPEGGASGSSSMLGGI
jgi:hypothetical protein